MVRIFYVCLSILALLIATPVGAKPSAAQTVNPLIVPQSKCQVSESPLGANTLRANDVSFLLECGGIPEDNMQPSRAI